jgi:DNA-binding NarL/FixJ family response regulator
MSIDLDKSALIAQQLPRQQREVLRGQAQGKLRKEIADSMGISTGTVNRHCEEAYRKLGIHTRTEAVRVAVCAGIV